MKFLSVITRTFKRPVMLKRNQCSLGMQSCDDFEHIVFPNELGVGGSYQILRDFDPQTEYVWAFDDDNILTDWKFVERLRDMAHTGLWDVIMCPVVYDGMYLPAPWPSQGGQRSHVDLMNIVTSRTVYNQFKAKFGLHYAGDLDFIYAVLDSGLKVGAYDRVIGESQKVSRGGSE